MIDAVAGGGWPPGRFQECHRVLESEVAVALRSVRAVCLVCLSLLLFGSGCASLEPRHRAIHPGWSLSATTPWDLAVLSKPPEYEWADRQGPVWSLYYQGLPYKDKPTRVFAYYASPATLGSIVKTDKGFPGVVLVHGGGGTAFKEWAELWAQRGYAAIAMDLAGCGPDRKRLEDGGPGQSDEEKFGAIDQPVGDQWPYHAVADVILAHSLLRNLPEVDARHTAVTGISWGGYLTCIVAGLDNRFRAAVPVYGCGFLYEDSAWLKQFEKMTPEQRDRWVQLWDPSMYTGSADMPVLFINGTNDFAYPLDSYAKTYSLVKHRRNLRITANMPHGHPQGWAPLEIGWFIDQYLRDGTPLPRILHPRKTDEQIRAKVRTKTDLVEAALHYTTETGPINKRQWQTVAGRIEGTHHILAPAPPAETTIWFLTVRDRRNAVVSSELTFGPE
jgi:dienelactone hydrolase